jgi:uncharacterized protein (TIGR03437 family)
MRFPKSVRLVLLGMAGVTAAHAAQVLCNGSATFSGGAFFLPSGGGGGVSFSFSGAAGCSYYVSSNAAWLTTSQSTSVQNNSTSANVTFTVAADNGAGRTGSLTAYVNGSAVATQQITQNGTACAITITSQDPMSIPASGSSGSFAFTYGPNSGTCNYGNVGSSASWLTVTNYAPFSISWSAAANTGAARSAALSFSFPPGQSFTVNQAAGGTPLSITTPTSLPAGKVAMQYIPVTFGAIGGTPPYTWSAAGLPGGLSFSTSGILSGTPTIAASGSVYFTVTDANGQMATVSLFLTINPPALSIVGPPSLSAGTTGVAYGPVTFGASGGTGSYTWSASGLPSGLSFSGSGVLSGTPGASSQGSYTPQFTVTDTNEITASVTLSLVINPGQYPLSITVSPTGAGSVTATPSSPNGSYATGTSVKLTATAAANFSFSGWSGDLAGSANPATLDMLGPHSVTANFTATSPQSLSIATSSIPPGLAGVVYQATTFGATGGTVPYSWSMSSGTLPGSMSLSSGGLLSGTPTIGTFPITVTVTDSSPTPLTASASFTLTVTQPGTLLSVWPPQQQLSFSYVLGDTNLPAPQIIGVLSNPSGTAVTASTITSDGGSWLLATQNFSGGTTPGTIAVSVDPTKVAGPNTYSGQINISAPNATPSSVTVYVTFAVAASQTPKMTLTPPQSFALPTGGGAIQGAVGVSNTGGGTLNYTSVASSDLNWLTITGGSQGSVTPSTPSSIAFSVNPNVAPGLHQGMITVTDSSGVNPPQSSNVTLLVSIPQAIMQLSETGVTFFAVQNSNVTPPPQSIAIYNLWGDTISWTTQVQYTGSTQGWLTVTPSGSSTAGTPGVATISVNPAGLAKGAYYATVNVPSGAFNSPQSLSVLLNVIEAGQLGSSPQVSTSGEILVAGAGSTAAATQTITLYSPAGANPTYSTNVYTSSGGNWLSLTPPTGSLTGGTASLTLQANAAALAAGVYYGTVQVGFSDGTIQTIQVALVATPSTLATPAFELTSGVHPDASSCTATTLGATFNTPNANTPLTVGQAQPFLVQIADNCNAPLLSSQSPTVQLFNESSSPAILIANLTPGATNTVWTGSWTPSNPGNATLRVFASRGQAFGGISTPANTVLDVTVLTASTTAAPVPAAAINGASFDTNDPNLVVPGGYVTIYGQRMADGSDQASGGVLPPTLGNTQLLFISNGQTQALPLLFVNKTQINGLIPQNLNVDDTVQLQVQRDNTTAVPLSVKVTNLQPGIFTTAQTGQGQGAILIAGTGTVAGPGTGPAQMPVTRGQFIEIYATGLGQVTGTNNATPPPDGQPAPASGTLFNTSATATVTIGGVSAPVSFAGLAPGFVALYQVNVQVPLTAPTGSTIPVVLTMTDSSGNQVSSPAGVTIAVQ